MSILFSKGIFAMIGIIENEMLRLAEYCNVKTEDGEKYGVIYNRLLQKCPKLHTDEEHKQLSQKFVEDFVAEFSYRELRVWFEIHAPITFGDEDLEQKYFNLIKIHNAFVHKWLKEHGLILTIDVYLFGNQVRNAYRKMGVNFSNDLSDYTTEYTLQLWGLIKTIRDNGYKKELVITLQDSIKMLLEISGGFYFNTLDLTKEENLKELYYTLSEALHMSDAYKGHDMFYGYDGYGHAVCQPTGRIVDEY